MDIISILILFFVISTVFRLIKKISQPAKNAQTQTEATKPTQAPKPVAKRDDFRFPSMKKPAPQPVFQEGRNPNAVMSKYTPISPSSEMKSQFSNYTGSLNATAVEGIGYQSEEYDSVSVPYREDSGTGVRILPENFNRDALLQAIVMSEILKQPGAKR